MFAVVTQSPQTTPFISLYGGGRSVVVDGDRDIRRRRSAHVVIIQIISFAVFVFLAVIYQRMSSECWNEVE